MGPKRILIVDDDKDVNDTLVELIRFWELDVITVRSIPDALQILISRRDIDLVLSDVRMPLGSGLDILEISNRFQKIPFLFLTAHETKELVRRSVELGAAGYLLKPFRMSELKNRIVDVLGDCFPKSA